MISVVNEQMINCRVYIGGMKKIVPPKRKEKGQRALIWVIMQDLCTLCTSYAQHSAKQYIPPNLLYVLS